MFSLWKKYQQKKRLRKLILHLKNWRHADDDILSEQAKGEFDDIISEGTLLKAGAIDAQAKFCDSVGERMNRIVVPKKFTTAREWLDIIAVAMAVAFGIRGLFFQPFKIPTSSMQPTLYGIHYMDREESSNSYLAKLPNFVNFLLFSTRPAQLTVQESGTLDPRSISVGGNMLFDKVEFNIGNHRYALPGAVQKVADYTQLDVDKLYQKGDVLADGYLSTGDHLFVDRISPYLFGLKRGDVMVFNTENIYSYDGSPLMDNSGFYYIKRLVGLPEDTLKIVDNQLFVKEKGAKDFVKIQDLDSRFERIYSGKGGYQGHLNAMNLANSYDEFTVPEDSYFMLGDNSRFSADSRYWGIVPRRNIVGKALFVFWPFSRRWGIADSVSELDVPTGEYVGNTYPSMGLQ